MFTRPGIKYQIDGSVMTYGALIGKADRVPITPNFAMPLVLVLMGGGRPESSRVAPESYPLLTAADARRLAYCRRILT